MKHIVIKTSSEEGLGITLLKILQAEGLVYPQGNGVSVYACNWAELTYLQQRVYMACDDDHEPSDVLGTFDPEAKAKVYEAKPVRIWPKRAKVKLASLNKRGELWRTELNFVEIMCRPAREPDFVSASGSKYWYMPYGLVRQSNHWGSVGQNWMHIKPCTNSVTKIGLCKDYILDYEY